MEYIIKMKFINGDAIEEKTNTDVFRLELEHHRFAHINNRYYNTDNMLYYEIEEKNEIDAV